MTSPSFSYLGALSEKTYLVGRPLRSYLCVVSEKSNKQICNVIIARRVSGLEEAMRIGRLREVQRTKKIRNRPPLKRGKIYGPLLVPEHIPKPPYVGLSQLPELSSEYQIHDDEGTARMRDACELAARVLEFAGRMVRPSITTNEIDKVVHNMIIDAGAYPSPLGYGGFPKSVCTSVNECMCHGIPDSRQLQDGDIINIDVTVYLNGYHGDTSKTFICGEVNEPTKRLVKVTEECLERAIAVCKDGCSFKKIGKRISEIAERYGFGVVERFVGHGVGTIFHSEPIIMHNLFDCLLRQRPPPKPLKVRANCCGIVRSTSEASMMITMIGDSSRVWTSLPAKPSWRL